MSFSRGNGELGQGLSCLSARFFHLTCNSTVDWDKLELICSSDLLIFIMAIAMTTIELTTPLQSSSPSHHNHKCKIRKHVHSHFLVDANSANQGTFFSSAAATGSQSAQKPKQKSQGTKHVLKEALYEPGLAFNHNTYSSIFQSCTNIQALKQVHAHVLRSELEHNLFLLTKLVRMYAICESMDDARLIFDKIYTRDVFLWNVMIRGYTMNGFYEKALILYNQMQRAGVQPDNFTFPFVLKACAEQSALQEGKEIHDDIVRIGFESDVFVGNSLIAMYAKCGCVEDARCVFDKMFQRDVVSWSAMIAAYAQNGHAHEALTIFCHMQMAGMKPNTVTMVSLLPACANLADLQQGKCVHGCIIRQGLESDIAVWTALINMYAKCQSLEIAHQLFVKTSKRNVVSWSTMIAGYALNGHAEEALTLFNQMQVEKVTPDSVTMVSALQACAHLGDLQRGKCIHDYIIRNRFESDVSLRNSLVGMYTKCGRIEIARHLFDKMSVRDAVSWSAMISGYAQHGLANEALILFHQMQLAGLKSDMVAMVSVLPACSDLAALQQGKMIHGCIVKSGFESNVVVGTALVDMYAKCGSIKVARQVFDKMPNRDVVSWSAMIAGYGMHGHGGDALALFSQMQQIGLKPNNITFISVLSACSHAGLVDEGKQFFDCMLRDYCITPTVKHYACMVDLLGRAGCLDEALDFINNMPLEPDASVWGALLGACRIHCNLELGKHVAECLFVLEPESAGCYVLLSNIYAVAGRWDDVEKVRTLMKDRGLKKTPGCSFIEVNNRVHVFLVGDRSHPQAEKIYATLELLSGQMKEAGYVPNTNFVLHDVEEEVKEHMLSTHSEKLAIAFGLINSIPGSPILITKNLRVCGDCHSATKFISKIVKREIIVRDANRFHHLKDGFCSCGDYW
eukprot:Gb_38301 [translate_table: standard]